MNIRLPLLLSATLVASISTSRLDAQAPVIQKLVPAAADVGDLLIVEGTDLLDVTAVRFEYSFQSSSSGGGSASGQSIAFTRTAPVVSATATRVEVVVPGIPTQSSLPTTIGRARVVRSDGTTSASRTFRFLEATDGDVETIGAGTTLSGGAGRAVTTFDNAAGLPFQGIVFLSETEDIVLQNAPAGATAVLAGGFPATGPLASIGDGLLAIGPEIFGFGQGVVDADGELTIPVTLARTAQLGIEFGFQFVVVDAGASAFGFGVATGLSVLL